MKLLQYPQHLFRIFGILPLDGINFNTNKWLEIFRMCLFPVPTYGMSLTFLAYFVIHIVEIGNATEAMFALIGFFNAALIYSMLMYKKQILLGFMNDLQALLDQRKANHYSSM